MKRSIGRQFAFYPMPVIVAGAFVDGKPDFTLVAHVGILAHDTALVSLNRAHYINRGIREGRAVSVNVVDADWLEQAAAAGSVSGRDADKSSLFAYTVGRAGTPMIDAAKLSMECTVTDIVEVGAFDNFVVRVAETFAEESILTGEKPDYRKFRPVLFEMPNYTFLETGETLGACRSFMKKSKTQETGGI